ncbi:hypothetical protein AwDysgo_17210 [Bacteroidales bacterium]|nr:hypothetical protein AwDysgo_17210 [Bacteroidales bacterium]
MAFVNEQISKDDYKKYGLDILPDRLHGLGNPSRAWTIDKERDIWLRLFFAQHDHTADNPGYTGHRTWDFYWKGALMSVETFERQTKPSSENNSIYYAYIELKDIEIPNVYLSQKSVVLHDLKQAFVIYAGAGIYANTTSCMIDLEYRGKLV